MKCDVCGAEIDGEPNTDTHDTPESLRHRGAYHGYSDAVRFYMCPACARERRETEWSFWWAVVLLIAAFIVIGLVSRL